jgi:hypothetical protein
LRTDSYECGQGTYTEGEAWNVAGSGACDYSECYETDEACSAEAKNLKHKDADKWFGDKKGSSNAEEDIDAKINKQLDKAIGDILSDVVERCISSSLKGCIEM